MYLEGTCNLGNQDTSSVFWLCIFTFVHYSFCGHSEQLLCFLLLKMSITSEKLEETRVSFETFKWPCVNTKLLFLASY